MVDEALALEEAAASMDNDVVRGVRAKELGLKVAGNGREAELRLLGLRTFAMKSVQLVRLLIFFQIF